MLRIAGAVETNSLMTFSHGLLHMDTPALTEQQGLIFISYVLVLKTNREWWPIGTGGKRESRESILSAKLDDDDDIVYQKFTLNAEF